MTTSLIASTTCLLALVQPMIAEAVNVEPMSGWQQLGVCGGCFATMALQSIQSRRGMREAAVEHKEGLISLAGEVKGLRIDIKENLDQQLDELRKKQ